MHFLLQHGFPTSPSSYSQHGLWLLLGPQFMGNSSPFSLEEEKRGTAASCTRLLIGISWDNPGLATWEQGGTGGRNTFTFLSINCSCPQSSYCDFERRKLAAMSHETTPKAGLRPAWILLWEWAMGVRCTKPHICHSLSQPRLTKKEYTERELHDEGGGLARYAASQMKTSVGGCSF